MNKKIKNATPVGEFKSKLEYRFYSLLKEAGYQPKYEEDTFILQPGFYPTVPSYDITYNYKRKTKEFGLSNGKIRPITYTPDFTFYIGDILIVIEVKGRENDVFPLKKKLFKKWMETYYKATGKKVIYFEIFTKKQMLDSIEIIREYEKQFIADHKETN